MNLTRTTTTDPNKNPIEQIEPKVSKKFLAVCLSLAAALSYSLMSFFIKLTHSDANQTLVGLTRFAVSWLWISLVINYNYRYHNKREAPSAPPPSIGSYFTTQHHLTYLSRATFTILSVFFSCLALKHGSMACAMALIMSQALFVPIVEKLLHKTPINRLVMLSMIIGFIGVLISLKPHGSFINQGSLWGLFSGISIAISYVNLRNLTRYDKPYTIMSIHFSIVLIINILLAIFYWRRPTDAVTWLWLLFMGIAGTAYQEFITRAMGKGSAALVSSLQYSSIIIGSILGWIAWRELPALHVFIGAILIVLGSILTVHFSSLNK